MTRTLADLEFTSGAMQKEKKQAVCSSASSVCYLLYLFSCLLHRQEVTAEF